MWKLIPAVAAATVLGACNAPPTIKYPSGNGARVPVNSVAFAQASTQNTPGAGALPPQTAPHAISVPVHQVSAVPAAVRAKQTAPLTPVPVGTFFVNAREQTALGVMRRWARAAKVDFTWESALDYPLDASMRAISSTDLATAVDQMRKALEGAAEPLVITLDAEGLAVRLADRPMPVEASVAELVPAPPTEAHSAQFEATQSMTPPAIASPSIDTVPAATVAAAAITSTAVPVVSAPVDTPSAAWAIGPAKSLREVIGKWTAASNVELRWETSRDFPLTDDARITTYSGDLRHALGQLAGQFGELEIPLSMRFTERGSVLRVFDASAS